MNRRSFLAGLMASAAVAPLAAKLPAVVLRTTVEAHEAYGYSPGMAVLKQYRETWHELWERMAEDILPGDPHVIPIRTISVADALREWPVS